MADARSSAMPGFYSKTRAERLGLVADFAGLDTKDIAILNGPDGGVSFERADTMVENALGTFALPLGVATNFMINGRDCLVPMAIEEPSVIAAASKGAKAARVRGGFEAISDESYSVGQVQLVGAINGAEQKVLESSGRILDLANSKSTTLPKLGRGAKEVSCRTITVPSGQMLIVELLVDVGDAMGANVTNTMCEAIAPLLAEITGARPLLRILSNYSTRRMARATATFAKDAVGGEHIVDDMVLAYEFADNDIYRAVTHNKGALNGIIAVANALGQDSRAIEAAANAYASHAGRYRSLTRWSRNEDGDLVGEIKLPLSVGIIGGVANVHPTARVCQKILGVESARQLAGVMAAVGLAQNYSAMRALCTGGIQEGHMRLHARNLATAAGAKPGDVDGIVRTMIKEGNISLGRAQELACHT